MRDLERNYIHTFKTPSGEKVLEHLRSITIERFMGANATESELRSLEAQRSLVHTIIKLASTN